MRMRSKITPRSGARGPVLALCVLLSAVPPARASMFQGEALDKAADVLTWIVLILVPILAITLFWMVHVLPEKIAHKRHHPQTKAIQVLCLLSLVFGGLLWPIAWLWAYTKPVSYRLAYGTDKSDDYFREMGERLRAGDLTAAEVAHLREELDAIRARGAITPEMAELRRQLEPARQGVGPAGEAA